MPRHASQIEGKTAEFDVAVATSHRETFHCFIEESFAILSVLYQHVGVPMGCQGMEKSRVEHGLNECAEGGSGADGHKA